MSRGRARKVNDPATCSGVGPAVSGHEALRTAVYKFIRGTAELRAVVQVLEHGTLPRTQVEARRVRDLR